MEAQMDCWGVRTVAQQASYFDAEVEQAIRLLLTGSRSVF